MMLPCCYSKLEYTEIFYRKNETKWPKHTPLENYSFSLIAAIGHMQQSFCKKLLFNYFSEACIKCPVPGAANNKKLFFCRT